MRHVASGERYRCSPHLPLLSYGEGLARLHGGRTPAPADAFLIAITRQPENSRQILKT